MKHQTDGGACRHLVALPLAILGPLRLHARMGLMRAVLVMLALGAVAPAAIAEIEVYRPESGNWNVVRTKYHNGWLRPGLIEDIGGFRHILLGIDLPRGTCIDHVGKQLTMEFRRGRERRLVQDEGILVLNGSTGEFKDSRWRRITITPHDDVERAQGRIRLVVRVPSWKGCEQWVLSGLQPGWEVKRCDS